MSLPEFPQIDLRKRRRRPRVAIPQAEDIRPMPPARARGPRGGRAVCQVASRTRPDMWYTLYQLDNGMLFCACPDFIHRTPAAWGGVQAPARPARRARLRREHADHGRRHPDPVVRI